MVSCQPGAVLAKSTPMLLSCPCPHAPTAFVLVAVNACLRRPFCVAKGRSICVKVSAAASSSTGSDRPSWSQAAGALALAAAVQLGALVRTFQLRTGCILQNKSFNPAHVTTLVPRRWPVPTALVPTILALTGDLFSNSLVDPCELQSVMLCQTSHGGSQAVVRQPDSVDLVGFFLLDPRNSGLSVHKL
jgi:hypothetical protein